MSGIGVTEAPTDTKAKPATASAAKPWLARFLGALRHRLLLLLAVALLPSILLGACQAAVIYREYADRLRQTVREFAVLASSLDRGLLAQSEAILSSAAEIGSVRAVLTGDASAGSACVEALSQSIKPFRVYGFLALFDREGSARCGGPEGAAPNDVAFEPWFHNLLTSGKSGASNYLRLPPNDEPGWVLTHPVFNDAGQLSGALALGIRLQFLPAVTDEAGLPPESVVYLLDRQGNPLASFDAAGPSGVPDPASLEAVADGQLTEFSAIGADGVRRLYAVSAIPFYDLHVLFGLPQAAWLDPVRWKVAAQILVIASVWILAMLAMLPGTRWVITRWTDRLTRTAHAMTRGDLEARADLAGAPEELTLLGATLAGLAARVQRREAELRDALAQHKTMLREVHHRVKNNLQTVTSLLNIHAKGPRAAPARAVFAEVQVRINALALVHRHLYESDDMRVVALRPFLASLCRLVQDGTGVPARQVAMAIAIDDVSVAGDIAVPIALLVTEVLTNAFKHGFPNGRLGVIQVRLAREGAQTAVLTIADNGVGLPDPDATALDGGTGSSLIRAFARQLDGEFTLAGSPGTTISVRFPLVRSSRTPSDDPEAPATAATENERSETATAGTAASVDAAVPAARNGPSG